jgi:Ca2+-transporting ATPase
MQNMNGMSKEVIETDVFRLPVSEAYSLLSSRPQGLSSREVDDRLQQDGPNTIQKIKGRPLYLKLLSNFTHLMAILLWIGGGVAFIAHMPQLAIAVWMVNVINGAFSFWQEYRAEKATEALRQLLPVYARVLRDGEEQRILAEQLVRGDVLLLAEGDSISADCRLVQSAQLRVDQSTLTGESRPVRKSVEASLLEAITYAERPNLIFAGTNVAAGTGKAIVFATGMRTEFGKIANLTQSLGDDLSPLQQEMSNVTKTVTVIAVAIGVLFFLLAAVMAGITLAESFIFALGMIVAFVPEGLLPTVTLALAMGTQRMAKRNALIKKLSAVETLGCTTVICTDKTGTLTQNEMTVRNIWIPHNDAAAGTWVGQGLNLTVTGIGYTPEGQIFNGEETLAAEQGEGDWPGHALRHVLLAGGLCNNARLLPPKNGSSRWAILGDPTEAALKVVAVKAGINLEQEEHSTPRWRELPFDSRRKRMSTIHDLPDQAATDRIAGTRHWVVYVKGAPKEILDLCTTVELSGSQRPLNPGQREQIIAANDIYARDGLRVLAIARRLLDSGQYRQEESRMDYSPESIEQNLTFLGLVAMMDPPRPEVTEAVQQCHQAGIRIVMITGDYGLTAESIARKIGIVHAVRPRIVTGFDLDGMDDRTLKETMQDEVIFARVAPEHKLRVVSVLHDMGQVTAVTGDGVNDAPALKKADIGVAMGLSGTDVAKEAADMILTDDNFASIVNAIEEGRAVYDNIKKFTTYIFTSNTPEAIPFILFAFSRARIPLALNVMHVLSIDLGTDIMPALALGTEPPEPGVMDRPPRDLRAHVINLPLLLRAYVWLGPLQSLAAMAAFYYQYWTHGYWGQFLGLPSSGPLYRSATAMALAAVVTTQIGNLFAQRSERTSVFRLPWFKNRLIWAGVATELTLIALIVYAPGLQNFIGTAAFPLSNWAFLFAWTPALLLIDELRKWLIRRRTP